MAARPKRNALPPDRQAPGAPDSPDDSDVLDPPGAGATMSPTGGVAVGEYITMDDPDDDGVEILDGPDGGAYVLLGQPAEEAPPDRAFYANLADQVPAHVLARIATDLLRKVEEDKEARKKRDEQYEEGIRRTGLGKDAPGGADFEGASRVVHPMLTEACIDYESRIIKELFPIAGPVKPKIVGIVTAEKDARAKRVTDHMNWQLTEQIKECRSVLEKMFTQVPLGGSQFVRLWWDHGLNRPRMAFVPIDNVYLPANADDYASASRRTFSETITAVEFRKRVEQGLYRELRVAPPSQLPEPSRAKRASQKVEGVDDPGLNTDGDREILEVTTYLDVTAEMAEVLAHEDPGKLYPYVVSIDATSRQVLALYRDWEDGDPTREPIDHLYEFPFLPWRGAYAIGFPQIIGGLSGAATGALRALLDSAHTQNAISGAVLKGSGTSGQTRQPKIGELLEVEGGLEADDIRKRVMKFDFGSPSPVLFQLLGFVVEAARGVVRTSLDDQATNTNANTPVGTQLSRVEEGLVVFSAVHGRAHAAFNRLLAGLHRLNRLYLPASVRVDALGKEILVRRADYEGPCAIQPVSDPTIYSDQQRFWQISAIQARAAAVPGLYKVRKVEEHFLRLLKFPDYEDLLADEKEPHELNAVNENLAMALGQPVVVFPTQDHLAHLQVLLDFMKSPLFGSNPLIAPRYLAQALSHAAEHIVYYYVQRTTDLISAAAGRDAAELMSNDTEVKAMFDRLLGMASQIVVPSAQAALAGAQPVLQQAMALLQQLTTQPPDPALAAVEVARADVARKTASDQTTAQLKAGAQAQETAAQNRELDIKQQAVDAKVQGDHLAAATKTTANTDDNITAVTIAGMRGSRLTDGGSLTRES